MTGGVEGNERLTALTGAVLLVLLAIEGVTLLRLHSMLTLHFFVGMLLIGPVLLKMGSTGYRFVRYYTGSVAYVRKGPPALPLRVLGPVVMITSIGVIGSGVALALVGPGPSLWLVAHKLFFVAWFCAMTMHVGWYAPQLPRLLGTGSPHFARARQVLAGAGKRWLLLVTALAIGFVVAVATAHLEGSWSGQDQHSARLGVESPRGLPLLTRAEHGQRGHQAGWLTPAPPMSASSSRTCRRSAAVSPGRRPCARCARSR